MIATKLTLSKEQVAELNEHSAGSVDKWFRYLAGVGSELSNVKNGIVYLDLLYSNTITRSHAESVAWAWLHGCYNKVLKRADKIVVTEYTDRPENELFDKDTSNDKQDPFKEIHSLQERKSQMHFELENRKLDQKVITVEYLLNKNGKKKLEEERSQF